MNTPVSAITDWQMSEWNRRKKIVADYDALLVKNPTISFRKAAKQLSVPLSKLIDVVEKIEKNHDPVDLIPAIGTGRPSVKSRLEKELGTEIVKEAMAKVKGMVLDTGSVSGSWRFLAKTGDLPLEISKVILDPTKASKHNIPPSLTDTSHVTSAQQLAHQGRRALKHSGLYTPREIDVLPGDIFVSDDTTPIWGWWVPWPKSKDYPFEKKMLQGQLLLMIDYASNYRIAYTLIAREHSSYRACDIWSFYGHVFDDIGLPRIGFQHEGGAWQALMLRGEIIVSDRREPDYARRVGAIEALPSTLLPYHYALTNGKGLRERLRIFRSTEARSKPVEGAFRMQQPLEGTIYGYLGTDQRRNPILKTKKIFEACQRGTADPGLHFLSGVEMMKRITPILEYLNDDIMEGPLRYGRPNELWNDSLAENPLTKLPLEYRWLYRRNFVVRTLNGPYIKCSYKDAATGRVVNLNYHNAELCARHCDERVVVYFDKQYPTRPAQIVTPGYEWLGQAEFWSGTGAFLDGNDDGFRNSANYLRTVMQLTKTIQVHSPSHQLPPEIAERRKEAADEKRMAMQTPLSGPSRASLLPVRNMPAMLPESTETSNAQTRRPAAKTWAQIMGGDPTPERILPSADAQTPLTEPGSTSCSDRAVTTTERASTETLNTQPRKIVAKTWAQMMAGEDSLETISPPAEAQVENQKTGSRNGPN